MFLRHSLGMVAVVVVGWWYKSIWSSFVVEWWRVGGGEGGGGGGWGWGGEGG